MAVPVLADGAGDVLGRAFFAGCVVDHLQGGADRPHGIAQFRDLPASLRAEQRLASTKQQRVEVIGRRRQASMVRSTMGIFLF